MLKFLRVFLVGLLPLFLSIGVLAAPQMDTLEQCEDFVQGSDEFDTFSIDPLATATGNDSKPHQGSETELSFDELLVSHIRQLKHFCFSLTRNHTNAEDLLQDVLERALIYADGYKRNTSMVAWLRTIARRHYWNSVRDNREDTTADENLEFKINRNHTSRMLPQESFVKLGEVQRMYETLSEDQQTIITRTLTGFSEEEMANELGVNPITLRTRLAKARKKLKDDDQYPAPSRTLIVQPAGLRLDLQSHSFQLNGKTVQLTGGQNYLFLKLVEGQARGIDLSAHRGVLASFGSRDAAFALFRLASKMEAFKALTPFLEPMGPNKVRLSEPVRKILAAGTYLN